MALQVKLVHGLAKHYGMPFKEHAGKALIVSLIMGIHFAGGVIVLGSLAKSIPWLGMLSGGASNTITAGVMTYAVGRVFTQHFELGGTLLDFNPKKWRETFQNKIKEGRTVVRDLRKRPRTGS